MHLKNKTPLYYTILFLFLTSFFLYDSINRSKGNNLTIENYSVNFLKVGQGDATLIQSPDNFQILIDGGPSYEKLKEQLDLLIPSSDKTIEVLILTHPDKDHMNGFIDLIDEYKVELIIDNPMKKDTKLYTEWERIIKKKKINRTDGVAGESIFLENAEGNKILTLEIIYPFLDGEITTQEEVNENSIVLKISSSSLDFLVTGDAGKDIESILESIYDEGNIDIDVLRTGHHGSKHSSGENFVKLVSPDYSIISVGKNSYGHPDEEVLNNLKSSEILRTDEYGTISFIFDSNDYIIKCTDANCDDL